MNAISFALNVIEYASEVARIGGNVIEALDWGQKKVAGFQSSEPTADDWAELRARRHANNAEINKD